MIVATIFLFLVSYLLASRNLMLELYVVTALFALYTIFSRRQYYVGASLIIGLLAGVLVVYQFFPKTFNRYRELAYTGFDYQHLGKESHFNMEVKADQWNGANFRLAAWECGWELFLGHPFKGVDIGDKKDALMEKYREKNFLFGLQTQKNVHNNYLDTLYSMGIVGLSLLLLGWVILPLKEAAVHRDKLALLMILTLVFAWITEVYFDRSLGGMLTGFFIPFLLSYPTRQLSN